MKIDLLDITCEELAVELGADSSLIEDLPRPDIDLAGRYRYLSHRIMSKRWKRNDKPN